MRLLIFSDIHGDQAALKRLMDVEADYYFSAGDLTNFGRGMDRLAPILQPLAERVYMIPGNHESASDNARFCAGYGFHDFHGRSIEAGGYLVAGLGYSNITPFQTPGEYTELEFTEMLGAFAGLSPNVMVCHCPPKDSRLDRVKDGLHCGSSAVREFIERQQPAHFFCGHIHEAAGAVEQMGVTIARNVGKQGYLLELP